MNPPDLSDHFEATDAEIPDGIYRVVGRDGERVTLLRVGDTDGRRVHTGVVVTVSTDGVAAFVPAENPDGTRPLRDALASKLAAGYWSIRVFARQLASNRLPTAVAVLLALSGVVGDQLVSLPDVVFGSLILVGSLGLAYIGSGRLSV